MKKAIFLLFIIGCDYLRPTTIDTKTYPDLEELWEQQVKELSGAQLEKKVWLEGEQEVKTLSMDTTEWKKELSFLEEINPNQPEYVGAFEEKKEDGLLHLILKEGEKGELEYVRMQMSGPDISKINASIHEDRDVYVHHRDIEVLLADGQLKEYTISGYQKIIFKDTITFRIEGKVINN